MIRLFLCTLRKIWIYSKHISLTYLTLLGILIGLFAGLAQVSYAFAISPYPLSCAQGETQYYDAWGNIHCVPPQNQVLVGPHKGPCSGCGQYELDLTESQKLVVEVNPQWHSSSTPFAGAQYRFDSSEGLQIVKGNQIVADIRILNR